MTEEAWRTGEFDAINLLLNLSYGLSGAPARLRNERRLRLYAVASLRQALAPRPPLDAVLDDIERFADARTNPERNRIKGIRMAAEPAELRVRGADGSERTISLKSAAARSSLSAAIATSRICQWVEGEEGCRQLLREVFGNPYRPLAFPHRWRSSTAVALATGIYADRAFDRVPILADALEEAGCDDADILSHCRGDGPHVRGCWVVDAVLGKK